MDPHRGGPQMPNYPGKSEEANPALECSHSNSQHETQFPNHCRLQVFFS